MLDDLAEVSDLIRGFMKIDSKKRIHISKVSRPRAAHDRLDAGVGASLDSGHERQVHRPRRRVRQGDSGRPPRLLCCPPLTRLQSDFSSFTLEPGKEEQPTSIKAALVQPSPDVAYELLFPNSLPHQYYAQGSMPRHSFDLLSNFLQGEPKETDFGLT